MANGGLLIDPELYPTLDAALERDRDDSLEWWMRFLAPDGQKSHRFTKAIAGTHLFQLSQGPQRTRDDGRVVTTVILSLALPPKLNPRKSRAALANIEPLAREHGLEFLGIAATRPAFAWNSIKWLTLDDAKWRLRHLQDAGHRGPIDCIFAFTTAPTSPTTSTDAFTSLQNQLTHLSIPTKLVPQHQLLLARIHTLPTDQDLTTHYTHMQQLATPPHSPTTPSSLPSAPPILLKGLDLWSPDAPW